MAERNRRGGSPGSGEKDAADQRGDGPDRQPPGGPSGTPLTQQVGRIAIVAIVVLFGVFAVVNAQFVDFSWIFGSTEVVEAGGERRSGGVPLIVLLVASFAIGALAGSLLGWRRHRRRAATTPTEPGS